MSDKPDLTKLNKALRMGEPGLHVERHRDDERWWALYLPDGTLLDEDNKSPLPNLPQSRPRVPPAMED